MAKKWRNSNKNLVVKLRLLYQAMIVLFERKNLTELLYNFGGMFGLADVMLKSTLQQHHVINRLSDFEFQKRLRCNNLLRGKVQK